MNMLKMSLVGLVIAVSRIALSAVTGTVYVDCNLKDYADHDGSSWAKAYKTIQEGIAAAKTDNLVLVAPGVYDEGGATIGSGDNYLTNRVFINKRITVRSRDGRDSRDSTFIVGRYASAEHDENMGMGIDAIRCVRFDFDNAAGAVLEGFTLCNGSTHYSAGKYAADSIGGGVSFGARTSKASQAAYLVDCVVSNCVATRGGGVYFGNIVRCRVTANQASNNAPGVRHAHVYWSIIDKNYGSDAAAYLDGCNIVNSTIVGNPTGAALRGNSTDSVCSAYNTVVLHNVTTTTSPCISLTNCVLAVGQSFLTGNGGSPTETNNCTLVDNLSFQFVAPIVADYRPLASSALLGAANVSYLSLIPEQYRYKDYEGNTVSPTDPLTAGAIVTPVTPTGGAITFKNVAFRYQDTCGLFVNDQEVTMSGLYAFSTTAPAWATHYKARIVKPLRATLSASRHIFGLDGDDGIVRYPLRGTETAYVIAPPNEKSLTVNAYFTTNILWASANVVDGALQDGTEKNPFQTLQAAVDYAQAHKSQGQQWIVYAKAGVYDKGGAWVSSISSSNRVAITDSYTYIRFYAVEGPDKTRIVGAEDPNSTHAYKYGPAAVRCFYSVNERSSLSGFTLADGRVNLKDGDQTEASGANPLFGGGVWANDARFQVEDCVFTNCVGSRGSLAWKATLRRCRAIDCTSSRLGMIRGGVHASACVFTDIHTGRTDDQVIGQDEKVYNCTLIGDGAGYAFGDRAGTFFCNTLFSKFGTINACPQTVRSHSYYDDVASVSSTLSDVPGLELGRIRFTDAAQGDYALLSVCDVVGQGTIQDVGADYWQYGSAVDIEGVPFVMAADGSMATGAYQRDTPSAVIHIAVPEGQTNYRVSPSGDVYLSPANPSVTFTAVDAASRSFEGFWKGDECVASGTTYTYTFDPAVADGQAFNLVAKYVPYWYVSPSGSLQNGGTSWADACQTLEQVMAKALPGDTVIAGPGDYMEGSMLQTVKLYVSTENQQLRARVVVPENVTLKSRDGAAATRIHGQAAPAASAIDEYGSGPGAMRGVVLAGSSSVLDGFTVTGGRSLDGKPGKADVNNRGMGVHGLYNFAGNISNFPLVKNCIISNNVCARAGGVLAVRAVNCRFFDNRALNNASAATHSALYNCYLDDNKGDTVIGYFYEVKNCTFGPNADPTYPRIFGSSPAQAGTNIKPLVVNTLVASGGIYSSNAEPYTLSNCLFTTEAKASYWAAETIESNCIFVPKANLVFDAEGRPVIGSNEAIDKGEIEYVDDICEGKDIDGNPRAINGHKMDIGCHEVSWLSQYGADLKCAKLTVTQADLGVWDTTESHTVSLTNGTDIVLAYTPMTTRRLRGTLSFRVTGDATLSIVTDGGEPVQYTASGSHVWSDAGNHTFACSVSGSGCVELLDCRTEAGMTLFIR